MKQPRWLLLVALALLPVWLVPAGRALAQDDLDQFMQDEHIDTATPTAPGADAPQPESAPGFVDTLPLFATSYAAALLIALVLGTLGVWIVVRNQIFLGAAVAEASTAGIALTLFAVAALSTAGAVPDATSWRSGALDLLKSMAAIVAAVASAWWMSRPRTAGAMSREALTGLVFVTGASAAILAVSHSPFDMMEVQRLLASSLIGATPHDVVALGLLAAVVLVPAWWHQQRIALVLQDTLCADALGLRSRRTDAIALLFTGLALGLSIRIAGVLFAFAVLVLPALTARALCRELRTMQRVAPVVAVLVTALALVLAHLGNDPPGPMAAALLAAAVIVATLLRAGLRLLRRAVSGGSGRESPGPGSRRRAQATTPC
ncbi:MAG: metal ABC transporter permease [Planctomycetota bacterium]